MPARVPKPEPVPAVVNCSVCGLDWEKHEKPDVSECIRLLRAELALRSQWSYTMTTSPTVTPIRSQSTTAA